MNLANLTTEGRNPASTNLDQLSALEIVRLMNAEDAAIPAAIAAVETQIADAIDLIACAFRGGGRLIYLGAGTSGRLGVLDAAECPPTFNSPPWQVVGLIAGGRTALVRAVEGAEDHEELGAGDLQKIECAAGDVVVGIATSGRTPYVLGGLKYARALGCPVIGLSCNPSSALSPLCDVEIAPVVGPEVVTGSTRLKAGTATKLVLNMLTTGAMVRTGKTYGNLMVDLQVTNQKLADRSRRIVAELAGVGPEEAEALLARCGGDVKTAIVAQRHGLPAVAARQLLQQSQNQLRTALTATSIADAGGQSRAGGGLVLGIDGGGTRTRAWLADAEASAATSATEPLAVGEAASSNVNAVGQNAAFTNIELAIRRAFAALGRPRQTVSAACLAVAGAGTAARRQPLEAWAVGQAIAERLLITHDAAPILAAGTSAGVGIALIAGTGSLAYGQASDGRTARAGGWGATLGDEGSGYSLALAGLRSIARAADGSGPATLLTQAFLEELGLPGTDALITYLASEGADVPSIAALAPVVLNAASAGDVVASRLTAEAIRELAALVRTVAVRLFRSGEPWELALAGGMLSESAIRDGVLSLLADEGDSPVSRQFVDAPVRGAIELARRVLVAGSRPG